MAYDINTETKAISLSAGDTMEFTVNINNISYDAIVFAVFKPATGKDILRKGTLMNNGYAKIELSNSDTKNLCAGRYKWQIRLVSNHSYDEAGNAVVGPNTKVKSLFKPNEAPDFILSRDGAYV